jgi:hypothetical protein
MRGTVVSPVDGERKFVVVVVVRVCGRDATDRCVGLSWLVQDRSGWKEARLLDVTGTPRAPHNVARDLCSGRQRNAQESGGEKLHVGMYDEQRYEQCLEQVVRRLVIEARRDTVEVWNQVRDQIDNFGLSSA